MDSVDIKSKNSVREFLTFKIGTEFYGISVDRAREVIEFSNFTMVPRAPKYIKGIINLRGVVVPVLDLPSLFYGHSNEITALSCIVIIDYEFENDKYIIGALIDAVSEVITIPLKDIENTPDFGIKIKHDYISGVGKTGSKFIILLNEANVFNIEDLSDFKKIIAQRPGDI